MIRIGASDLIVALFVSVIAHVGLFFATSTPRAVPQAGASNGVVVLDLSASEELFDAQEPTEQSVSNIVPSQVQPLVADAAPLESPTPAQPETVPDEVSVSELASVPARPVTPEDRNYAPPEEPPPLMPDTPEAQPMELAQAAPEVFQEPPPAIDRQERPNEPVELATQQQDDPTEAPEEVTPEVVLQQAAPPIPINELPETVPEESEPTLVEQPEPTQMVAVAPTPPPVDEVKPVVPAQPMAPTVAADTPPPLQRDAVGPPSQPVVRQPDVPPPPRQAPVPDSPKPQALPDLSAPEVTAPQAAPDTPAIVDRPQSVTPPITTAILPPPANPPTVPARPTEVQVSDTSPTPSTARSIPIPATPVSADSAPPVRTASASPPATVPPAALSAGGRDAQASYVENLSIRINALARESYPRISLRRKEEGWVPIRMLVNASGEIIELAVVDRSNAPNRLIEAALSTVRSAAPFPRFAAEMGDEPTEFVLRVNYVIQ